MCQISSLMAATEGPVAEFSSFANLEEKKRKSNLLMSFPKTGNQMGSFGQIRKNSFFRFCWPILYIFGLTLLTIIWTLDILPSTLDILPSTLDPKQNPTILTLTHGFLRGPPNLMGAMGLGFHFPGFGKVFSLNEPACFKKCIRMVTCWEVRGEVALLKNVFLLPLSEFSGSAQGHNKSKDCI